MSPTLPRKQLQRASSYCSLTRPDPTALLTTPPPVQTPVRLCPFFLSQCPPTSTPTLTMKTSSPVIPQDRDCPKLTARTRQDRLQRPAGTSSLVSRGCRHCTTAAPGSVGAGKDRQGSARGPLSAAQGSVAPTVPKRTRVLTWLAAASAEGVRSVRCSEGCPGRGLSTGEFLRR